jgi:hypothetical protein
MILGDTTSGTITMSLPAAATAGNGFQVSFKKIIAANSFIIDADGAELIDGAANYTITKQYQGAVLVCSGTGWDIQADGGINIPAASETVAGIIEIATDAEFETGTDTARALTAANVKNGLGYTKYYDSGQLALGSWHTLTHGLGVIPVYEEVEAVCVSGNLGYAVGEVIGCPKLYTESGRGVGFYKNTTQIGIICTSLLIFNKNTTSASVITPSSWRIQVRAWA